MSETGSGRRTAAAWLGATGLVVLGLGVLAAGAIAVFVSSNEAGAVALVVAGVVLVVVGVVGERFRRPATDVHSVRGAKAGGGVRVTGASVAASAASAAAPVSGAAGMQAPAPAPAADAPPAGALQTAVSRGHKLARRPALHPIDVQKLFGSRDEGRRVTALAIIQKRPELGSLAVVLAAIDASKSAFEQQQGLEAALAAVDAGSLGEADLSALRAEVSGRLAAETLVGDYPTQLAERLLGR